MRVHERIHPVGGWKAFFLLCAGLVAGIVLPAQGATSYYVDARDGNDAWPGMQAAPEAADGPWRSLRRVSTAPLEPGDTVHLKCGSVWRETLALTASGTSERPIVIKAYGDDCAAEGGPLIDAAMPLSGWRDAGGGVYATKVDFEVTDLYVDGQYLPPARYPHDGWLRAVQSSGATALTIRDPALETVLDRGLAGGSLRVRSQDWLIEERQITGVTAGGGLNLNEKTEFPVRPGSRYYLLGLSWMLSYPGAWVYDASAGEVRVWLPDSSAPAGHSIEAPRYSHGLLIGGAGFVEVENLRLRHSRLSGVMVANSHEISLRNLVVRDAGQNGINIEDSQAVRVSDSTVGRSQWNGIVAARSSGITVRGNAVTDSSMVGAPTRSPAAINLGLANWVLVEANTIRNSGYAGIRFKRRAKILNNTIVDSCQVLDDCGAIYTWADNDPDPGLNSEVVGNLIDGTRPSDADTPYPSYVSGIYLDDLTNGVKVAGNTVTNADSGVHIHNGFNLVVESNTLKNNRRNQVYLSMGHPRVPGERLSNNRFSGNTFQFDADSLGVQVLTDYPGVRHAEFDNNHYIVEGSRAIAYEAPRPGMEDRLLPRIFSLDRWRSERQQEAQGTFTALKDAGNTVYRAILLDADFSRDAQGWNAWSPGGKGILRWHQACPDSKPGCLEMDPKSGVVLAVSKHAHVGPGRHCELRIRARTDAVDNPVQVRLRRDKPPFSSAGLFAQSLVGNAWGDLAFRFATSKDWEGHSQIELKATGARTVQLGGARLSCR